MYILRVEQMVAAGKAAEYEAQQARFYEMLRSLPGFVRAVRANSLGYPSKFVSLNRWESREAARAAFRSETYRSFVQANPTGGIYTFGRAAEAYETVLGVVSEGPPAAYMNLVEWTLNPGQASAFESSRKEVLELRQKHAKDYVAGRLYRFLGNPNRYLVANLYSTLEGFRAAGTPPKIQEWQRAHPDTDYASTPNVLERYEVVQRVRA